MGWRRLAPVGGTDSSPAPEAEFLEGGDIDRAPSRLACVSARAHILVVSLGM